MVQEVEWSWRCAGSSRQKISFWWVACIHTCRSHQLWLCTCTGDKPVTPQRKKARYRDSATSGFIFLSLMRTLGMWVMGIRLMTIASTQLQHWSKWFLKRLKDYKVHWLTTSKVWIQTSRRRKHPNPQLRWQVHALSHEPPHDRHYSKIACTVNCSSVRSLRTTPLRISEFHTAVAVHIEPIAYATQHNVSHGKFERCCNSL